MRWLRWVGAVILFVVAYVHVALFLNMMSFRLLPILFLINGVGAAVAMVGVLLNARWVGWSLGILMSGGAAIARLAINNFPGVGRLLMGMPPGGMNRPRPAMGSGPGGGAPMGGAPMGGGGGPRPGGRMHSVLPLFMSTNTAATVSIIIELAFVALAIYALVLSRRNLAAGDTE